MKPLQYSWRTLGLFLFVLSFPSTPHASVLDPLTSITFDRPVHFLAPDGSDVLMQPGEYSVERAEEWIRLIPGERRDALLIEARKGIHELPLDHPLAMAFPGDAEKERDHEYVMLLLPEGQSLESTGTHSGIRPRGTLKQVFDRVKLQATETYKKAQATAMQSVSDSSVQRLATIVETQRTALLDIKRKIETNAKPR